MEQAIGAALEAFEDGMYLVVLDGEEQRNLDAQVYLRDESRIAFVRLRQKSMARVEKSTPV